MLDAASTVVGIIVGSGIFFAPAAIAQVAPHPATAALLWFAGAIVAGFGALAYAECSARLPHNGGFVVFYERAWGRGWAFVAGWAAALLTYPASLAGMAMVGAFNLGEAWPRLRGQQAAVAAAMLLLAGLLNGLGMRLSAGSQRLLSGAKLLALATLGLAAIFAPSGGDIELACAQPWLTADAGLLTAFAVLMWSFDGWTDVTLIAGEVRDPGRSMARAVIWGLGAVASLYALIQVAVMVLLPGMAAQTEQVVAVATRRAFGPAVGNSIAWLVFFATMGAVHSCVLVMSRLTAAMAQQGALPGWIAVRSRHTDTPLRALAAVVLLGSFYLLSQSFADLVRLFSFVVWLFYGFTALTLLRLRRAGVGAPLPYRIPGGVLAPYVLMGAAVLMTSLQVRERPHVALPGLACVALIAVGVHIWEVRARARNGAGVGPALATADQRPAASG